MEKKLVLAIDFNNLIYCCWNSRKWHTPDGREVGAVINLINKIISLKDQFDPDYLVFASDLSRTQTFRRKLYPMYKAQRAPTATEIQKQMQLSSHILALLGYPIINDMNFEGDDVLGMISRLAEDNNMNCIIVSCDHDMYQLITENTWVMDVRRNILIDIDEVYNSTGLYPSQWVDYKILLGDNSDNIPGVPNIGKKSAPALIRQYGSLSNIYNHISEINPAHQAGLLDAQQRLDLLYKLMTIVTDYTKLNITVDKLRRMEPFTLELAQELRSFGNLGFMNAVKFNLMRPYRDKRDLAERKELVVTQAVNSLDKEYNYPITEGGKNNDSAA